MAKFNKATLEQIVRLATERNYKGKKVLASKMKVCKEVAAITKESEDSIYSFLERNTYQDFWTELDAIQAEQQAAKPTKSAKPAADTMAGSVERNLETMPVMEGTRFLVTTVQNNTEVHPVWGQLLDLADNLNATLVAMPVYYNKNAFSPAAEGEDRDTFAPEVRDYLQDDDVWLGGKMGVRLAVEAYVLPTAKKPISAAAQLNAGELVTVVASPKQQMLTLPRPQGHAVKEAWTTGAATVFNYTSSRAGAEAETEHVFGALLVEIFEDGVNVTNVRQSNGSLMVETWHEGTATVGVDINMVQAPCVVLGDLHCEMIDAAAFNKTADWLEKVRPSAIAVHDVLHFETRSHHNRQSGRHLRKMWNAGKTVLDDLNTVINQINHLAQYTDELYIVESNHNSALDNWLDDSHYNPKQDQANEKLYYLLNWAVCEMLDSGIDKTALEVALADLRDTHKMETLPALADNVIFGRMDEPHMWNGTDVSSHGHKGQNGSQGNTALFSKWRIPMVTAHTHSPAIMGDVLTVGVMARLDQGYNRGGASSWNQANGIIHDNGSRQLVRVNLLNF